MYFVLYYCMLLLYHLFFFLSRYIAFYLNVDFKTQLERLKKRGDEEQQIIKRLKNDDKDFENVIDIVEVGNEENKIREIIT